MRYCAVTFVLFTSVLFTSLALAQTSPPQRSDVQLDPPEHHVMTTGWRPRLRQAFRQINPVITIEGMSDHP